jgi:hypothetical protein
MRTNFSRKSEGNKPLGRTRCGCDNNIKVDLKGVGFEIVDLIQLFQYRVQWRALLNVVVSLRIL